MIKIFFNLGENRLNDRAVLEGDGFRLDEFLGRMRLRSRLGTFVDETKRAALAFSDFGYFVKLKRQKHFVMKSQIEVSNFKEI